jgi:gluconolactonase
MLQRRIALFSALLVGAGGAAAAARAFAKDKAAPAAALPATVKSFEAPYPTVGTIERLDPAFDKYVPPGAKIEKLAEGFDWIEGPQWVRTGGYLLFSEIPLNSVYRWQEKADKKTPAGVSLFLQPSGYFGTRTDLLEPGSNALGIGKKGELILAQHGERRLAKVPLSAPTSKPTLLADKYEGKRLNSPNDFVVHSSGDIFFTDPPYGLQKKGAGPGKEMDDPDKELKFQGVYRLDTSGKVHLLSDDLERPNGIGLSPDEKTLYVANSHRARPIIRAFDVQADRSLANPRIFFNGTTLLEAKPNLKGSFDGLVVAADGTLFASGPGGILVITPAGKHLGTISTGESMSNADFGGPEGKTLFITSDMYLVKLETATKGRGF